MTSSKGSYNSPFRATLKGITDLYSKKTGKLDLPGNIDLTGRTIMITGASSGLGFATALRLAKAGANLVLPLRSGIPETGEEIKEKTGLANLRMYPVDLADFESIDNLILNLNKDRIKVDTVISNAAMVPLKSRRTPQGLEEMFMVNYLSAFYLINRMLTDEIIDISAKNPARIIITSSESHRNAEDIDWDEFGKYRDYGIGETVSRYGYFKLFLTAFANELARRMDTLNTGVHVRALCPGPVNSNIAREAPAWMQPILKFTFSLFFRSPEKASDPLIYFASEHLDENAEIMRYLFLMQEKETDPKAVDPETGKVLWNKSKNLVRQLGYSVE